MIRVLMIAHNSSAGMDSEDMGLADRTASVVNQYGKDRVRLAFAYMADDGDETVTERGGITYYPLNANLAAFKGILDWDKAKIRLLDVIRDFEPDVIQCFGAEWPYGAIAEDTDVPVVIHMMGFLNIYYPAIDMAVGYDASAAAMARNRGFVRRVKDFLRGRKRPEDPAARFQDAVSAFERRVMAANRYFMGRTEWDKGIVRYYSPGARYYHVPEVIKSSVVEAAGQWHYHGGDRLRLLTVSSGDDRKGNEIILRTAALLKELLHLDFEWIVTGKREFFTRYEKRTGITCESVNVQVIGLIKTRQIIEELKAADFFIHPSIVDNSPNAVCEAQLVGCPVIASNVGGLPQFVEHDVTGFLYPYSEPHALAFFIGDLYKDGAYLERISRKATETALARHDDKKTAEALIGAYEDIIKDHGAKG